MLDSMVTRIEKGDALTNVYLQMFSSCATLELGDDLRDNDFD